MINIPKNTTLTIEEFAERYLRPIFIEQSKRILSETAGFKAEALVWFNGSYKALPK